MRTPQQEENDIQLRQFLQQLRVTEESIVAENWVAAAEQFDAAWQSITEGEDPSCRLALKRNHRYCRTPATLRLGASPNGVTLLQFTEGIP